MTDEAAGSRWTAAESEAIGEEVVDESSRENCDHVKIS